MKAIAVGDMLEVTWENKKGRAQVVELYPDTKMRAKFKCEDITKYSGGFVGVTLQPVVEGSEENKQFWKNTPQGQLKMNITNPIAQGFFEPGKEYYLDITPAE